MHAMHNSSSVQYLWDSLLDTVGDDPFQLYVLGPILITWSSYWIIGSFYIFMDVTNKPSFLRRYKTQPSTNEPVDWGRLLKAIFVVNTNLTLVALLVGVINYPIIKYLNYDLVDPRRPLPSPPQFIYQMIGIVLVEEIGFYYAHRLFHHPLLYKYFHKKHHEWQSPISITALYAHPLEHAIANILPIVMGPVIMDSHILVMYFWFVLSVMVTLNDHSGYHLPFYRSPEFHDYHHLKFNECFGVLGMLDYLHGTSKRYRESPNYSRDKTLFTFTSARELYPDVKKDK